MISLPPDEVERRFGLLGIPNRFTPQEKAQLATTDIVSEDEGIIAFQLLGTDPAKQPSFFDHPWYLEEPFARVDCGPGWHFLHMDVRPDSISRPINYISSLRDQGLALPSAIEVALMLFLHYAGTGEQLLRKKHSWCWDQASMNRFVTVGAFGRNGLFVSGHPAEFSSRGLGICTKVVV
ncbi:MAG: hypothetical protein DMF60_16820 [Acidobacteria bacterium]|nr:MAG: hypothetical protein DMF60_16820 [Acidobacteriota bacterium]